MSKDNKWIEEWGACRAEDKRFHEQHLLGAWDPTPKRVPDERVVDLAGSPRKAEFVTVEETMLMALEVAEARRAAFARAALTPPEVCKHPDETDAEFKARAKGRFGIEEAG